MVAPGNSEELRARILDVLTRHGAVRIALFGSVARGDAGPESDVGVLVRFGGRKSLFELIAIEQELSDAVGRHVDLVTEQAVDSRLRPSIARDEIVLFGRS